MVRARRIVAAALVPCATLGVVLVALVSGTAHGGTAALVTLQVAPRGPGVVYFDNVRFTPMDEGTGSAPLGGTETTIIK